MAHLDILKVNVGKRSLNELWRKCTDMMNLKNKCKTSAFPRYARVLTASEFDLNGKRIIFRVLRT